MAEGANLELASATAPVRNAVLIRQDIAAKRESISETVDKLGKRLHRTIDWREYVVEYPAIALGLAAAAGLLISGIFRRKPAPGERIFDAVAELTEDVADDLRAAVGGQVRRRFVLPPGATAVLAGAAAKTALTLIRARNEGGPRNVA